VIICATPWLVCRNIVMIWFKVWTGRSPVGQSVRRHYGLNMPVFRRWNK
jgi:hypothetical protein